MIQKSLYCSETNEVALIEDLTLQDRFFIAFDGTRWYEVDTRRYACSGFATRGDVLTGPLAPQLTATHVYRTAEAFEKAITRYTKSSTPAAV